jgi:hypothetical protein
MTAPIAPSLRSAEPSSDTPSGVTILDGGDSHTFAWKYWFLASLLLGAYLVLAWWFPLLGHADKVPLADIRTFAPTLNEGLLYALLVCALFGAYWLAYQMVRRHPQPPRLWAILLPTLLYASPLLLTYPVNAVDVYRYFFEGRMMVAHGANPLLVPPNVYATDPFLPFAAILLQKSSPYGPLWELTGAAVYWLSGSTVIGSVLLFKLIGFVCHLVIGLLIWQMLGHEKANIRNAQTLLWLWNPALLFMFVMDAHNDILMLLFLLLGYQQICRRRPVFGLTILTLAPLIKPIGILPLPFFAIAVWQQSRDWRERLSNYLLVSIFALAITFLAFLPLGSPMPLVQRLVDESQTGPSFSTVEFAIALSALRGVNLPLPMLAKGGSAILAIMALIMLWLTWRGRNPLKGVADIFATYLVTSLKFRIWYPSWLFPWLVLDVQSRYRLYAGVLLLLISQLSVILYSHIRLAWLAGSLLYAHLLGVPLVFLVPPALAYFLRKLKIG